MAFHPHFLAVAAAFVTAARDKRLVSAVEDFPADEDEFSRLESFRQEAKDLAFGASGVNGAIFILVGLGG
jgi:hypothetical protein